MSLATFLERIKARVLEGIAASGDSPEKFYAPKTLRDSKDKSAAEFSVRIMAVESADGHEAWLTVWSRSRDEIERVETVLGCLPEWEEVGDRESGERVFRKGGPAQVGAGLSVGRANAPGPAGPSLQGPGSRGTSITFGFGDDGTATTIHGEEGRAGPFSNAEYRILIETLWDDMTFLLKHPGPRVPSVEAPPPRPAPPPASDAVARASSRAGTVFARLAVERGYLTQPQVDEAFEIQNKLREDMGVDQPIEPILVGKKWLSADQAQELRNAVAVETGEARLVAGYEAISKLGQGGMGAVYKAKPPGGGDLVALKILPPSLADEKMIARFTRESEIVKKLHHENIVRCIEFGFDKRRRCHFCALELVEGEDLGKRIVRLGTLPEDEVISIARQIAKALQHACFNRLVHRDVKPENIMVTPDGTAKLLDLGLARPANQEATRMTESGMFVGSPYYASPEQALGEREVDIRSDLYSFGATLYHMVTGEPPFEGTTPLAILQRHVTEKLPWPASVNPDISYGLCLIITKMMAKSPGDRYQMPNDAIRDLDLLTEGSEPQVAEATLTNSSVALPALGRRRRERPASRARVARGREPGRPRPAVRDRREPRPPRDGEEVAAGGPGGSIGKVAMGAGVVALMVGIGVLMFVGGEGPDRRKKKPKTPPSGDTSGAGLRKVARKDTPARAARRTGGTRKAPPPRKVAPPAPRTAAKTQPKPEPTGPPVATPEPPPAPVLRNPADAIREADLYRAAHPQDVAGAIARFQQVARDFPETRQAREAELKVIELQTRASWSGPAAVARDPMLVGWWRFDEGEGALARDSSRGGNHGTVAGGARWGQGRLGGALVLDGSDDCVTTSLNIDQSAGAAGATFSAWVKPASISGGTHQLISTENGGWDWVIARNGGVWMVATGENGHRFGFGVETGIWQHVAAVFDPAAGNVRFYKNGVESVAPRIGYDTSDGNVCIGRKPGGGEFFDGLIDDVCIYSRALSRAEVAALHRGAGHLAAAEDAAGAGAGAGGQARARLEALLSEFDALIRERDYAAAGRRIARATEEGEFAGFAGELAAARGVSEALEARRKAVRRAIRDQLGKEIELQTSKGKLAGKVAEVSDETVALMIKTKDRGASTVETRMKVKWAEIAPRQEEELARQGGWKPEEAVGAMARAYLAFCRRDFGAAQRALFVAGAHPLAAHLGARMTSRAPRARDEPAGPKKPALPSRPTRPATGKSINYSRFVTLHTLKGHGDAVVSACFSPDGRTVLTASKDRTARTWDAHTGQALRVMKGYASGLGPAVFSPDGRLVMMVPGGKQVLLWNASTGQVAVRSADHGARAYPARFSTSGHLVASAGKENVLVWETASGQKLHRLVGHTRDIRAIAFSPDDLKVLTVSSDNTARIWDATGNVLHVLDIPGRPEAAAFSRDGRMAVTGDPVRLWDAETGAPLTNLEGHAFVEFSPDGLLFLTIQGREVHVWDARRGSVVQKLKGHSERITSAAFSRDSLWVVTASEDRTVRVRLAASGRAACKLAGHKSAVLVAAFSPDRRRIVTASQGKIVYIWGDPRDTGAGER